MDHEDNVDLELQKREPLIKQSSTGPIKWRALLWHVFVALLVLAHLAAFANYIHLKVSLYSAHHKVFFRRPWLLLLLMCEFLYFISGIFGAVEFLLPPPLRSKSPLPQLQQFPKVDILLPCCKEPADVLQDSILAALDLDYPKSHFQVLVLDDGADDQLKAFCEELYHTNPSIFYLRRQKFPGVPHNFKCGNINFGLQKSHAEFVVMMDADMILHPSFLKVVLPHIVDNPDVAFVQVPQSFYNLPPGDPLSDAWVFGYERVLIHRDNFGMAACVGTGAIFRRKHLDEIGGFQPMSITEDTMTAYVLFNHGFRSVYINQKLQVGLTPWTFEGYIKQRQRWCVGAIQQFSSTWRAMLGPSSKLQFIFKTFFVWHTWHHYLYIVNVVMLLIFITTLAFHLPIAVGDPDDNRRIIVSLSIFLILWRISWTAVWAGLPQSVQSRNRDESHFWWMTPFFVKTIMQSIFSYSSTFRFTPTSSIDRIAAGAMSKQSPLMKHLSKLKHVKIHVVYVFLVLGLIGYRLGYIVLHRGENCREIFFVVAVSLFLLTTCAHMLVPIIYVLCQPGCEPTKRKELLHYKTGVPRFLEGQGNHLPKWHWSSGVYESISLFTIFFWLGTLVIVHLEKDKEWCNGAI